MGRHLSVGGFSPGSVVTVFSFAFERMQRDPTFQVTEPSVMSEFEVQAFLWHGLRQLGWNVRGEVKARFNKRTTVRFDLAVFNDSKLKGIIEVKGAPIKHKTSWTDTRQGTRYSQFDVPVRIIYGYQQATLALEEAKQNKFW